MVQGAIPVQLFFDAFDNLWNNPNQVSGFASTHSALWNDLQLPQISGKIAFSPHNASNALLQSLADDISTTSSSLMYSLAFLYQTPGPILNSIETVTNNNNLFVYGISDRAVGGLNLQKADGNLPVAFPENLLTHVPEPFKSEPSGGNGIRMHHKFVVIDFDKPNARVYMGSYNFSSSADLKNGENLFFFQDRRIAVSYMIQAVSMFDHYEFRDFESKSTAPQNKLYLHLPPQNPGENPWWLEDFTDAHKIMDREMFSKTAS
jgi:phosphatidylserine/phosphatidylglycerophosphate/cardiolipin synthase-like enzyme